MIDLISDFWYRNKYSIVVGTAILGIILIIGISIPEQESVDEQTTTDVEALQPVSEGILDTPEVQEDTVPQVPEVQ